MEEQLLYPALALVYFAALSWESRGNRLILGTAASLNVFCLFVLAQPICLSIGGYQGVAIYGVIAMTSYAALPRTEKEEAKSEGKKKGHDKSKSTLKKSREIKTE